MKMERDINKYINKNNIENGIPECHHSKLVLLAEYEKWSKLNDNLIKLKSDSICDDGRISLQFSIGVNKHFTLFCPLQYPNYEDNFFVEATPSLQLWCNTINEFILDSESVITLENVLYKAAALFYKNIQKSPCNSSSESEVEGEEYMLIGDESDEDWEYTISQKKKQWRLKEAQLRAVTKQPKTSDMFEGSIKDHPKQVFSNSGASGILTNDLVGIMKSAKETGINAEPIEDNIYKWSVYLSSFESTGKLEQDLCQLYKRYGYSYVQLQLDFTMDLYPFYPPIVKVVRPRLQGSMMLHVAGLLKLSHWNPARDMKSVLQEIKHYLDTWARLDLNSERNHIFRFPQGAYIDIENHLLWLACVSEVPSRANHRYPEIARDDLISYIPNNDGKKDKALFPAGTGYSSSIHTGWDINAYQAAQREKDKQVECVLQKILLELRKDCSLNTNTNPHSCIAPGFNDTYSSFNIPSCSTNNSQNITEMSKMTDNCQSAVPAKKICSLECVKSNTESDNTFSSCNNCHSLEPVGPNDANGIEFTEEGMNYENHQNGLNPVDHMEDLFNVLEASSLVPFLEIKLQVDSFLEICQHTPVYRCVVDIIKELAVHSALTPLLWNLPDQNQSLYSLVNRLEYKAKAILDQIGKASANGNIPKTVGKKHTTIDGSTSSTSHSSCACPQEASEEEKLARDFYEMSRAVSAALREHGLLTSGNLDQPKSAQDGPLLTDSNTVTTKSLAQSYRDTLKEMQFLSCDIEVAGASAHHFSTHFKSALPPNCAQVMRIAQEMAALSTALPLDLESGIFIRTDDAKCTLLRALIIGPEGTPYSGGCFQFDIFFPPQYPTSPPLVHFCTTGLGQVCFNPNLYASGMVCLSLLGTWKGLQGEHWHPTSTLLQVLVSIQSLILVPEPFFNEPGYESLFGTSKGTQRSQAYNKEIIVHTIRHAMVSQLRRPCSGFEDVIRAHFYIKKNIILQEIKAHMLNNSSKDLCIAYESLKTELDKLTSGPVTAKNLDSLCLNEN